MTTQRLDKWLFFARLLKSRTLAQAFIEDGHVRRAGQPLTKPCTEIKPGDVLTLSFAHAVRVVRVRAPGTRRGPASEAQQLYEEISLSASFQTVSAGRVDSGTR